MESIGEKVYIRFLQMKDSEALLDLEISNKDFFEAYLTPRQESFYTKEFQENMIASFELQRQKDRYYVFGVFDKNNDLLVGKISLFDIRRGPLQTCTAGVYIGKKYNGKGYCTDAGKLTFKYAFEELSLHRIELKIMPRNKGSISVAEKCNFQYEGIAYKSVLINGKWEDHMVYSLINDNYKV